MMKKYIEWLDITDHNRKLRLKYYSNYLKNNLKKKLFKLST